MSNTHVWRAALARLQREVTGAQFNTWLRGAQLVTVTSRAATVHVRSTYERELIESRYHDLIERALSDVIGAPIALTIATAPGGSLQDGASTRGGGKPSIAASQATYARPLFLLDEDEDAGEPTEIQQAARVTPRVEQERQETRRPLRARIPDSPVVNGASGVSGMQRGERNNQSGVTFHGRQSPNEERDSFTRPVREMSSQEPSTTRRRTGALDGNGGLSANPRTSGSAARNGEMTSMSNETHGRFDDDPQRGPATDLRAHENPRGYAFQGPGGGGANNSETTMGIVPLTPPRLNQRYTFSTFIVGSGNQLAHAASQAVADAPGYAYNPLFLYGGVGLGKTHLLHAIGHTALERNLTVLYVSSETFTNEIVNAILYRKTEEFRAKYRSVDVLLVDDIQFIAGKDSTEEEFFHTFNSLYETNRQIVICSDRPPKAIISLEERLRSRFEWGLIADIQPPDLETRIAILRAKAEVIGQYTPDEVILYVANRVPSNIRELEGSLNRVLAFAKLQGLPMTIETAKAAMASLATDTRQRRVSIEDILNTVAEYYRIPVDDLKGKQRDKHIVMPRQVAMYLMRQETEASLLEIGQSLGGRDHSTVLHGCDKITREIDENTTLRKEVLAIRQQLLG
ncbi:MAG TPA: chromosomal replication initiator protein DnaA [Ktedonobacterales bacterium]